MSAPLRVIPIRGLNSDTKRMCEAVTFAHYAFCGAVVRFVWEGVCYLAIERSAKDDGGGAAPAGAVAYAKTLLELNK